MTAISKNFSGSVTCMISVSKFAQLEWCSFQTFYSKHLPTKLPTESMQAGSKVHNEIDIQVTGISAPIKVRSRADIWALKFLNSIQRLELLALTGVSREIHLFGKYNDTIIHGIVDQVKRDLESYEFVISDTKTLSRKRIPSRAVSRGSRVQVSIYKYLWDSLVNSALEVDDFTDFLPVPETVGIEVATFAIEEMNWDSESLKLGDIIHGYLSLFSAFKASSPNSHIIYISNKRRAEDEEEGGHNHHGHKIIGTTAITFDKEWLTQKLETGVAFWTGSSSIRDLQGVDIEEAWKCRDCDFEETCEWRIERAQELCSTYRRRNHWDVVEATDSATKGYQPICHY